MADHATRPTWSYTLHVVSFFGIDYKNGYFLIDKPDSTVDLFHIFSTVCGRLKCLLRYLFFLDCRDFVNPR